MPVTGILSVVALGLHIMLSFAPGKVPIMISMFLCAAGCVLALIARCQCTGFGGVYIAAACLAVLGVLDYAEGIVFCDSPYMLHYWLPIITDGPDGEVEFSVSPLEYSETAVGDTVTVLLYDGAFADPYYLLQTSGKEK